MSDLCSTVVIHAGRVWGEGYAFYAQQRAVIANEFIYVDQ